MSKKGPWTIHVCPDCGRVQGYGGRCRNAFAHEPYERVMLEAFEVALVPSPARGRWTVTTDLAGELRAVGDVTDPELGHPLGWKPVEVVPVPDEQAIERAAFELYAAGPWDGHSMDVYREMVQIVLAHLEDPEAPSSAASRADRSTNAPVPPAT